MRSFYLRPHSSFKAAALLLLAASGPALAQTPDSLDLPADNFVQSVVAAPNGGLLLGGAFNNIASQPRHFIARVNPDGSLGPRFDAEPNEAVLCVAQVPDGSFFLGGRFTAVGSQPIKFLARFLPNGTLDTSFNSQVNSNVWSLVTQPDGKLLVAGPFTEIKGAPRRHIARLNQDGTLDDSFAPTPDHTILGMAVQPDGKILVGGAFQNVSGQPRSHLARLTSLGQVDPAFNPGTDSATYVINLQPDGQILVGGDFAQVAGQAQPRFARLNPNGSLDTSFHPVVDDLVLSITLQADGKMLIGGLFHSVQNQNRTNLARLHSDGTLDNAFAPQADDEVYSVVLQNDGRVLVAGSFMHISGVPRARFARLSNTEPATQTLSYNNNTITWLRGGSGPELNTVTFDYSSDGQAWTLIGPGTRINGGWQLLDSILPPSVTLRARGYTGGGDSSYLVQQTITLPGAQPGFANFPADVTVDCAASTAPAATGTPDAASTCANTAIAYADQETPGNCVNQVVKVITRTWTVTDACGSAARNQTITVRDTTSPAFVNFPANVTVECGGATTPGVTGQPGGTDACGTPTVTFTDTETPGNCVNQLVKTITRAWRVADTCGNFITQNQTITVRDTTNPVFTNFPSDTTVNCNTATTPAATGTAQATDSCSVATVTFSDVEVGDCLTTQGRIITRTWKATDSCGNFMNRVQTITVREGLPFRIVTEDAAFGFKTNVFGFHVTGQAGTTVILQASDDGSQWLDIATNTLQNGIAYFSDSGYTNHLNRIYRAKRK